MLIITGTSREKIMVEKGNNFEPICSVTMHPLERYSTKSILMIVYFSRLSMILTKSFCRSTSSRCRRS